jgi:hypothetical protein
MVAGKDNLVLTNLRHSKPTRLATSSVRVLHDIIKHKKEGLKLHI